MVDASVASSDRRTIRLPTAVALGAVLALLVSGCTGRNAGEPTGLGDSGEVDGEWVYDASGVGAFARAQRDELARLAADSPNEVVWAAVTFGEPLAAAEAKSLIESADVTPRYFEWMQAGTDLRGGGDWRDLVERAAEYADLQVIYVRAQATAADLASLAVDEHVWLVDAGGQENLFDFAREAGLIAVD